MPSGRTLTDRHIAELAELYSWRHHGGAPRVTAEGYTDGFPAHVLVRAGRLVFVAIARPGLAAPEREWAEDIAAVRAVEIHVVERGELRRLTSVLRPGAPSSGEPRAPPAMPFPPKNVRPSHRGGRRKQPSQAPPNQEEQCEGPTSS